MRGRACKNFDTLRADEGGINAPANEMLIIVWGWGSVVWRREDTVSLVTAPDIFLCDFYFTSTPWRVSVSPHNVGSKSKVYGVGFRI